MKPGVIPLHQANANNNKGNTVIAVILLLVLLGIIGGAVWYFKYRAVEGDKCTPKDFSVDNVNYKYNKDLECVGDKLEGYVCDASDDLTVTEVDNGTYIYTINNNKMECTVNSCVQPYTLNDDKTQCIQNNV